jgi:hypothetical protein
MPMPTTPDGPTVVSEPASGSLLTRRAAATHGPALRRWLVGPILLAAALAAAAEPRPVLQGSWIATAGKQVFRGTWSAQALPGDGNAAVGSWTLTNDAGDVVMQGTWSARKAPRAWRGTWRAVVQPTGKSFSGTWQAAITADFKGKTFEDLLQAAGTERTSGVWRMGRAGGNWWLDKLPR